MYRSDASQPLPLTAAVVATLALVSLVITPDTATAQSNGDNAALRACDGYMELYARSAARKLGRALSGQGYALETVDLSSRLETNDGGQDVVYATFVEKEGHAVGLVDAERRARQSFVVVGTQQGLVVTSHNWPSRDAIADGKKCRPVGSKIVFPEVAVRSVDVEPFKYWGLRISWHLPESFDVTPAEEHDAFVRTLIERVTQRAADTGSTDASEQHKAGNADDSANHQGSD